MRLYQHFPSSEQSDDDIVTQVHLYGARIVSGLYSHKLSLVEKSSDPRISPSVVTYLNTLIFARNQRKFVEVNQ